MKRLTVLLSIVFFVFGCIEMVKVTETETVPINDDFSILYVEVIAGNIDINNSADNGTDNSAGIDLIAEKFAFGFSQREAEGNLAKIEIETYLDGDTYKVIVKTPFDDGNFDTGFAGGANLTLNNVNGKEVVIVSTAGNIECDDIAGALIEATAGNIEIEASAGDVEIDATAGEVEVGSVAGDFNVNATAGNVKVESVQGDVDVDNTAGNIIVEDFSGKRFDIDATAGSVEIEVTGEGAVDGSVVSTAGSIELTLSNELSCIVDLTAVVGSIDIDGINDFNHDVSVGGIDVEVNFTLNEGEGEITAETTAGSIEVDVR